MVWEEPLLCELWVLKPKAQAGWLWEPGTQQHSAGRVTSICQVDQSALPPGPPHLALQKQTSELGRVSGGGVPHPSCPWEVVPPGSSVCSLGSGSFYPAQSVVQ